MTRWFTRMVAVAVAGLAATTTAKADIAIGLQEAGVNGGNITVVATSPDFTSASFGAGAGTVYGDFLVKVFSGSSVIGVSASNLLSSTTSITNQSSTTQTLHLWVSQVNYTMPAGTPLTVESGLGGSVTNGILGFSGVFQAFADNGNHGITNNNPPPAFSFTNGPQNASPMGSTFDTGSAFGSFPRTDNQMYSLASEANITLSAGATINYSDHVIVTPPAAVPAPPALFLVGAAVPVLAVRRWNAKRKAVAAA
jgi:hypothetical protein